MRHKHDDTNPSYTLCGKWQHDAEIMAPEGELVYYDLWPGDSEACHQCYLTQEHQKLELVVTSFQQELERLKSLPDSPLRWEERIEQIEEQKQNQIEMALELARHLQLQSEENQNLHQEIAYLKRNLATLTLALGFLTKGGNRQELRRLEAIHQQRLPVDPEILSVDPDLRPYFDFNVEPAEEPDLAPEPRTAWDRVGHDD